MESGGVNRIYFLEFLRKFGVSLCTTQSNNNKGKVLICYYYVGSIVYT